VRDILRALGIFLLGSTLAIFLGASWVDRINRPGGIHLVTGHDFGPSVKVAPPRRTLVAVVDGLGFEDVVKTRLAGRLKAEGACWRMHTGQPSISRPMYTVLSSGVEQARTGIRNNTLHTRAPVESIWEVARGAGLQVSVISEIPWWVELFPKGFASYRGLPRARNFFTDAPRSDVTLVHTLYVDEAGHSAGAASQLYADAVERTNTELAAVLDTLDRSQDLLVVTADHGHAALGGHGGLEPRVATVLTCAVGRGVRVMGSLAELPATALAPALAVLLGIRFPAHMRAVDAELASIWPALDEKVFSAAYVADRQAAVSGMRVEQEAALRKHHAASLDELFTDGRRWQFIRAFLALLLFGMALQRMEQRVSGTQWRQKAVVDGAWLLVVCVASVTIFLIRRETFDLTAPNERDTFVRSTALSCALIALAPVLVATALRWDVLRHQGMLVLALGMLNLAHPAAFGWELGYPLPAPWLLFFPFFAAVLLWSVATVGVLSCVVAAVARLVRAG